MTKIAEGQTELWLLFDKGPDGLLLSVLCGSIGMYERRVILTKAEEQIYHQKGAAYLDSLARDIARNDSAYADRDVGSSL